MTQPAASGPAWAQRLVRTNTVRRESNLPPIDCVADLRNLDVSVRLTHDEAQRKVMLQS